MCQCFVSFFSHSCFDMIYRILISFNVFYSLDLTIYHWIRYNNKMLYSLVKEGPSQEPCKEVGCYVEAAAHVRSKKVF